MPYNWRVEFIEAPAFTKFVYEFLEDDEFLGLQMYLLQYPEAWKIIPGSGGIRKLRGKSGGVRIIYYFRMKDDEIWLLTIYSKSERENIPTHFMRQIAKEIEDD